MWLVIIALYKISVQCIPHRSWRKRDLPEPGLQPPRKLHTASEEPEQGACPLLPSQQTATYLVSKKSHPFHVSRVVVSQLQYTPREAIAPSILSPPTASERTPLYPHSAETASPVVLDGLSSIGRDIIRLHLVGRDVDQRNEVTRDFVDTISRNVG